MNLTKTLSDISNGPDGAGWGAFGILLIFTLILLSGKGANLVAGFNTASPEEKAKYDRKKLSRITGGILAVPTVLTAVMLIWEDVLPAAFATVFGVVVVADVTAGLFLINKYAKKQ